MFGLFAAKTFDGAVGADTNRQVKHQDVINVEKSKASIRYALRRLVSSIGQEYINQKTMTNPPKKSKTIPTQSRRPNLEVRDHPKKISTQCSGSDTTFSQGTD